MTEWFDIYSLSDTDAEPHLQTEGLGEAVRFILGLVEEEVECVGAAERVVLGGISQGEATALQALLCGQRRLGAFVGVSGWLPFAGRMEAILRESEGSGTQVVAFLRSNLGFASSIDSGSGLGTPVFLGHGMDDIWVDVKLGEQVRDILEGMGVDVTWKKYVGAGEDGHWLKETEEFDDIVAFLREKVV